MENIENLKSIIAKNLTTYRKKAGITQQELADKLNYSDKSISKWERGEGVPDIYILKQIADLYGVTVNDLIETTQKELTPTISYTKNKILIALQSIGLVWLVATILYALSKIILKNYEHNNYIFFYALPITFILVYIFNRIWFRKNYINFISISLLFWTSLFSFYWTMKDYFTNYELFFYAGIPFQIIVIFWYLMDRRKKQK